MDPKFIELHDKGAGELFGININHIVSFGKEGIILTGIPTDIALATAESYDEIKQLIKDSGILIHKADPRLDTSHPLTYEEMLSMPGQPVWHSNTDQWALIAEEPQYADRITVRHTDGTYSNISREDTVAKPWYRMKHEG